MTPAPLEAQLMRLAAAIAGFREEDAALHALTFSRDEVRAALADLVERGKLRQSGARYWRVQ